MQRPLRPPAPRSWLAAVVRQRVHLLSLASHKLVHSLPPLAEPQPAITALAFTADGASLVVAGATHQVAAYSIASGQPTEWTQRHGGALPAKLLRMPGSIVCIGSSPAAPGSLFLQSSEACCHLDMAAALEGEGGDGAGRKRRRVKPPLTSEPPGANCRMIYCSDPVLHAAYLGPEALLVVSARSVHTWRRCGQPLWAGPLAHAWGACGLPATKTCPSSVPPTAFACRRWSGRGPRCTSRLRRPCTGTATAHEVASRPAHQATSALPPPLPWLHVKTHGTACHSQSGFHSLQSSSRGCT